MNDNSGAGGGSDHITIHATLPEDDATYDGPSADPWMQKHPWVEPLVVLLFCVVVAAIVIVLD